MHEHVEVKPIARKTALNLVVAHHYLHRRCQIQYAFGLVEQEVVRGVVTFGLSANWALAGSICPTNPSLVLELNRLWTADVLPRNTESWFLRRALVLLPPLIVVSYADTAQGHIGTVYQAANFFYAGWTDMERKNPRKSLPTQSGKHNRHSRLGGTEYRSTKIKYWTVTGNKSERRRLKKLCAWPRLDWRKIPPPREHRQLILSNV